MVQLGEVPWARTAGTGPNVKMCHHTTTPMGIDGLGALTCVSATARPWAIEFGAASRVKVHGTSNQDTVRLMGPTEGSTG